MRSLVLLASAVFAASAFAGDATLTWTNPSMNTDGTAIPASGPGSLTDITVFYGFCDTPLTEQMVVPSLGAGTSQSSVVSNLEPGRWCFALTAKNTYDAESARTGEVFKVIEVPVPLPPVFTQESVAYEVTQKGNGDVKLGRRVGVVAYGVPCQGQPILDDYYVVSQDYVLLTKEPRSSEVVVRCGVTS